MFKRFTISDTSPASASTALGSKVEGLDALESVTVDADLVGATGGTLDVYLQRKVADNVWRDWIHFTQLTAGGSAVKYTVMPSAPTSITTVGTGTDSAATPALAAAGNAGGHPGTSVRAVYVAGSSTSAGAAIVIRLSGRTRNH